MLPRRIPKPTKRASRWRSQAHANFVRSHECSVAGCGDLPIEFAHVRLGSGAGIGQKPDDWRGVSLCRHHHSEQHRIGEATFWTKVAWRDVEQLIAEFCAASPRAAEIHRVQSERSQ